MFCVVCMNALPDSAIFYMYFAVIMNHLVTWILKGTVSCSALLLTLDTEVLKFAPNKFNATIYFFYNLL